MIKPTDFAYHLTNFLSIHLPGQQGASANTIKSYRDTFSLLLKYFESELKIKPEKVTIKCAKSFTFGRERFAYLDTNFTVYYNKLRITKAQDLFTQGASIKEVSHTVEYQNLNYFYRKFKEQVGVTPKEFINNCVVEKSINSGRN